jgi:hypothetical protein
MEKRVSSKKYVFIYIILPILGLTSLSVGIIGYYKTGQDSSPTPASPERKLRRGEERVDHILCQPPEAPFTARVVKVEVNLDTTTVVLELKTKRDGTEFSLDQAILVDGAGRKKKAGHLVTAFIYSSYKRNDGLLVVRPFEPFGIKWLPPGVRILPSNTVLV